MHGKMRCVHCRCRLVPHPRARTQRCGANQAVNGPAKRRGSATNWPPIPLTGLTNATANTAGNGSRPSTGARIANNGRRTAPGTGCCTSSETTNAVLLRWQRWT